MTGIVLTEFRSRFRRALFWMGVGGSIAIAAIFAVLRHTFERLDWVLVGVATVGTAIVYAALWYADHTECPGCQTRIGLRANPYRINKPRHRKCAVCNISFDQPSP